MTERGRWTRLRVVWPLWSADDRRPLHKPSCEYFDGDQPYGTQRCTCGLVNAWFGLDDYAQEPER